MTKLARGDLALSVSLTAVISLVVVITVPLLLGPLMRVYIGGAAPKLPLTQTALTMFALVAVPVGLGVFLRSAAATWATKIEPGVSRAATILFVGVVAVALISFWDVFIQHIATLGPALMLLNLIMLIVGLGLARLTGLGHKTASAISIETGIQNATLGITVAGLVAAQAGGAGSDGAFSAFALASGIYGISMYAVSLPFVLWRRFIRG